MNPVLSSLPPQPAPWTLPYRGKVCIAALIVGESALFTIFVVAYLFYLGKSTSGPTPSQVLKLPIVGTICLLSSSISIHRAERTLKSGDRKLFLGWLSATILLGLTFMVGTALEWWELIYRHGLTISTNLFGTTFYSLVGLHATHVVIGLTILLGVLFMSNAGLLRPSDTERFETLALYWHFVDAVWIVVFSVVYLFGR